MKKFTFDRDYYERWYGDDETRTFMKEKTPAIVNFVLAYIDYMELDVKSVLDVGCGLGYWQDGLEATGREFEYTGLEISDYLCGDTRGKRAPFSTTTPAANSILSYARACSNT